KFNPTLKRTFLDETTFSKNKEKYKNFCEATETQLANKRKTKKVTAQTRLKK
ncbi:7188_t:CDS:1, partial [Gigaspora rosea]